ncbi:MAG: DUF3168 domain-containing protein [Epibacterium sp.]|nr:DUF3168 domain-containing protein [Epibacterium sp.]NQX73873.1 DUF3168 domain-containing protein [Epibacterium sp.]
MMTDDLQRGVYTRLNSVAAITGAVTGIYTDVPQAAQSEDDSAFPYLTIGPFNVNRDEDKGVNGVNVLFQVHIWSRSQSALTWRAIEDDIYNALHRTGLLTVGTANVVECVFEGSDSFDDPDGRTHHCVTSFRVLYRDE